MAPSALDSAISALEADISSLERSVDSIEALLWIATTAVVIGVAAELWGVIHEYREDLDNWRRGNVRPPDKPSRAMLAFNLVAVLLVVLGVAGELGIGVVAGNRNAALRTKSRDLSGLIREKAGNAERIGGDAMERSRNLEIGAKQSEQTVLRLRQQLVSKTADLAREQRKSADAQKQAYDAQRKLNAGVVTTLLNRRVSARMKEFLSGMPAGKAEIEALTSDIESLEFATEIRLSLLALNWTVPFVKPAKRDPMPMGVVIVNKEAEGSFFFGASPNPRDTAEMMKLDVRKLRDAQLAVLVSCLPVHNIVKDESMAADLFRIIVGKNVLQTGAPMPTTVP